MGNLSFLPQTSASVEAIYSWREQKARDQKPRTYLGASIIGHECDRLLWYAFRHCYRESFSGRMLRLFDTGHREEARIIEELRGIGCAVYELDPDNPTEQISVSAVGGHFKGHLDAMVLGLPEAPKAWHVAEFKTYNADQFAKLKKSGVKTAKPLHYAQMQSYMALTKQDRAFYLAVNKDTDELYSERINYDAAFSKSTLGRAERIIKCNAPPERMASRVDDFRCKWCAAADLCWGTGAVALPLPCVSCRTCVHSTPEMDGDGRWSCQVSKSDCKESCPRHLVIPGLIMFAEPEDAGDDFIVYKGTDGKTWRNGGAPGDWTAMELMKTPALLVGTKVVNQAKHIFMGKVVDGKVAMVHVEPDGSCLWEGTVHQEVEITAKLKELLGLPEEAELPPPVDTMEEGGRMIYDYDHRFVVVLYPNKRAEIDNAIPF